LRAISIDPRLVAQRIAVTLGEQRFVLHLRWRDRTQAWYLDLHDTSDAPIVTSKRLAPNSYVTRGLVSSRRPAGGLFVYVRSGDPSTIGPADLGDRVALLYLDADDQAEILAALTR